MKKKAKTKTAPMPPATLRRAAWTALLLIVLPVAVAGAKIGFLGFRILPGQESPLWILEGKMAIAGGESVGRAILHVPTDEPGQTIIEEKVLSLGHPYLFRAAGLNRLLDLTVERGEVFKTYYRAALKLDPRGPRIGREGEKIERYLKIRDRTADEVATLERIAASLPGAPGSVEAARAAMAYVRDNVTVENAQMGRTLKLLLKKGAANPADRVDLHVDLARAKGIPTRKVTGFRPETAGRAEPETWVEHLVEGRWHMSIPDRNIFGAVGAGVIVLQRGEPPVAYGRGLKRVGATFRVTRDLYAQQEEVSGEKGGLRGRLSLYRLPAETQKFVKLLLLVPLAALVVVFFRLILRGETVGTFLPVILALSFRSTELVPGLLMLTAVLVIGMAALILFRRIGLPRIPSTALMVTVIVVILAYLSLAGEVLDLYRLEHIAFFPIVIMTLLVERISSRYLDGGLWPVAKIYVGTVAVAAASYLIITQPYLQSLFMRFPELLAAVMGLIVAVALWAERRRQVEPPATPEAPAGSQN